MGFQNTIKLLKSDEQNLNYKNLKLNLMDLCTDVIIWVGINKQNFFFLHSSSKTNN